MNKYFETVFVINRSVDVHRMGKTHSILSKNNIKYSRYEAVVIDDEVHSNITKEMLGCALSHMNIWKEIVNNKLESALIFEDDMMLVDNWEDTLDKSIIDLPKNWDILTLGNFGIKDKADKYNSPFNFILYALVTICNFQNKKYNKITNNIIVPYFFTGLYGYAVSYKGAKKLLALINDINDITFHIDVLISCKSKYLNIYSMTNDIVYQRIEESTINTYNKDNKKDHTPSTSTVHKTTNKNLKIHLDLLQSVDNKNIKYNYYMNVPVYKLRCLNGYNIIVNGWFITLTLILLFIIIKRLRSSFKL
jgi:GR25 family glycosyltransferase involved in LPS biosynthesis